MEDNLAVKLYISMLAEAEYTRIHDKLRMSTSHHASTESNTGVGRTNQKIRSLEWLNPRLSIGLF